MLRETKQRVQVMVTEGQATVKRSGGGCCHCPMIDWFLKEFVCLLGEKKHSEKSEHLDWLEVQNKY